MKCLLSCCSLSLFLTFPLLFTLSLNPSSCRNCEPTCCSSSTPPKLSPSEVFASFIHSLVLSHTLLHVPYQAVLDSHTPHPGTLHYSVWSLITCSWIGLFNWWISSRLGLFQAGGSFVFERRTMVQGTVWKGEWRFLDKLCSPVPHNAESSISI